jgi:hypothetical protein
MSLAAPINFADSPRLIHLDQAVDGNAGNYLG